MPTGRLPAYRDLLQRADGPPGSSWGIFGDGPAGDQGTLSLLQGEQVLRGAASIVTGERFALNYPIDAFDPPLLTWRDTARLRYFSRHAEHLDDVIDGFNPQTGSQIDGLRHRRHERYGFYNATPDADVSPDSTRLGMQQWAETGIAGRAVLLDVERSIDPTDIHEWHSEGAAITTADLESAVAAQRVELHHGDVLLLHTGWAGWYLEDIGEGDRQRCRELGQYTGLAQSRSVVEWIWDHGLAMVATDTFAVERMPAVASSDFSTSHEGGMMHQELLALLGLALGELWRLRPLARACLTDDRWDCLLTSAPLHVRGGISTPANALALR